MSYLTLRPLSLLFVVFLAANAHGAPEPAPATSAPTTSPAVPAAAPAPAPTPAPLRDPESRLAQELSRHLPRGKPVELAVGERKVLALYTEQTTPAAKGTVLLLHDWGGHADWPGVIASLRRELPAQGWNTFSLQLPVPTHAAPATQALSFLDGSGERIDAALAHLAAANTSNVVVIGHGLGGVAALEYAAAKPQAFRAMVLVGLPHFRDAEPRLDMEAALAKMALPALDIYGSGDRLEVTATARQRREAARNNPGYSQRAQPGADHFFAGQESFLTGRVRGWLERHAVTAPGTTGPTNQPQTQVTP